MKHIAEKPVDDDDRVEERKKFVIDRYEKEAKIYDETTYMNSEKLLFHELQCMQLEKLIDGDTDSKVLDVGCGTGRLLKWFSENIGYDMYGVEPAKNMIKEAQRKTQATKPIIKQGDIENIPFPNDYFDRIITTHVLMHLHPQMIHNGITEMYRVLKPGGYMLLDFPAKNGIWNIIGKVLFPNPTRTRMYTKKEVKNFGKEYNYEIKGLFSYPRVQYKYLPNLSKYLELNIPLPLMFKSQLILKIKK